MSLQIGQKAPDFTLFDSDKKEVSLSQYRGKKVLLLFFPFAFSSTCTEELCSVRDNMNMYEGLDVQPIGISVDSVFCLAAYRKEQNLSFPLLSDFNKAVSEQYGALYETWGFHYRGVTKRAAFVLDEEGTVQYAEVLENASELPNFEKIRENLRTIHK